MSHEFPVGWYATADGEHERYWDGTEWGPGRSATPVELSPVRDTPDRLPSGQPSHVYRDLPRYSTCPPHEIPPHDDVILYNQPALSRVAGRRRVTLSGAGFAWLVALWPALATGALVYADAMTWTSRQVDILAAGLLAAWFLSAIVDTARVRARGKLFESRRSTMSWWWVLCPPAQLIARTSAAHSTRLLPYVLLVSLAYPAMWLMPDSWFVQVSSLAAFIP